MATYGEWIKLNNEVTQLDETGRNKLYKDKEAKESYEEYVKENTKEFKNEVERFHYMIDNGLYDKVLKDIPSTIIEEMHNLAYSYNFEFQSFMAVQKFYENYSLIEYKEDKSFNFIENYEQHNVRVALYLFKDDYVKAREMLEQMMEQTVQLSTPTYLNSGVQKRGELSSCYLFVVDDNIESMNFVVDSVKQASKHSGGVAVDATRIRPKGASVQGQPNASKGVIPFAKSIEQGVSHFDQAGKRQGSAALYLNIFHQDIEDVLSSKKINASEKVRLDTLSLGVTIPNKFMELVEKDSDIHLFDTYNLHQVTGKHLDEIDFKTEYEDLVNNPKVETKKIKARDLMTDISKTQLESGYPYVFYIDNANDNHPLKNLGKIRMSNLCK